MRIDPPNIGVVGRFAPSPTGALHFGSLVTAVASALAVGSGRWLLRVEDVDRSRALPGVAADQLALLETYGFVCEEPVLYQSTREPLYQEALDRLIEAGFAYPCTCSRRQLATQTGVRLGGDGAPVYPGWCSHWQPGAPVPDGAAWRFRVGAMATPDVAFTDQIQGTINQHLVHDVGDFVLRRADGCTTYQLAVVVDDGLQGVTQVVRGADLLDSTPRQIALLRVLGGAVPEYAHVPVVANARGEKLSKQTLAQPIPCATEAERVRTLWAALQLLGQSPPDDLQRASQPTLWAWARSNWRLRQVPHARQVLGSNYG